MKKIVTLLIITLISVMMMPDMTAAPKKKARTKARTTTTTSASSSSWIGGEIPSPAAVCKAWIDYSGTAAFEKALRSKGYSEAGGMWEKDLTATFKIEGSRANIVIYAFIPSADLYDAYLKAAKAFVKGKSAYEVYEEDGNVCISKLFY